MAKKRPIPLDRRRPKAPREPSADKALQGFFAAADPELLKLALRDSDFDSKYHHMAILLEDPGSSRKSLATLSREVGISLIDLVEKYRETTMAAAHLEALGRLPEIVKENAVDALPTREVCPRCDGTKREEHPERKKKDGTPARIRCQKCLGAGTVRVPGLTDAKKLIFQHEGLIEAGGGAKVQVNVGSSAVPNLMDAIEVQERALKMGEGKVVDVEAEE